MKTVLASLLVLSATACATGGDESGFEGDEQEAGATTYVDILDFSKTDQGRWYDTIHHLNAKFVELCGDGSCGGPYGTLVPLTFGCSVSSKLGSVHECVWTFATSSLVVDTRNARVLADVPLFQCKIFSNIYSNKLIPILEGNDPLRVVLPGSETIMKQLDVCFQNPLNMNPGELAKLGTESYVAATDYYTTAANQQKWVAAKAALVHGFDNVCGDTFCSSDFNDLQAMDFECSVTKSTGNVKACTWAFAGSFHTVPEKSGAIQTTTRAWKCDVKVKGSLSQLITTLTAAGTTDAIRRPLPGTDKTAYDALLDCQLSQ